MLGGDTVKGGIPLNLFKGFSLNELVLTPPTPLKQEEGQHILALETQNPLLFKRGQGELGKLKSRAFQSHKLV